jgi:LacI family transcriptional regulator
MSLTRKVNIKDVAKRAGVSPATAARVAGKYGNVSETTRQRVLSAIQELGYQPDAIARSMVTRSTRTIGLVVTDITNPFFAELARGVESITWSQGYSLFLADTDEDIAREKAMISTMREKRVDGIILVPASSQYSRHLSELVKEGTPLVLVDRAVSRLDVDRVMVDNEQGAYQAVSHLASLGHRRIAMILDNPAITTNTERLAGYRRALKEYGLQEDETLILICRYTSQSAYQNIAQLLERSDRPTALFTANNFMTLGALQAIYDNGLQVSKDIALVGFDDLDRGGINLPKLTAVAQPVNEIGQLAAQRLITRMQGKTDSAQEYRLKTRFIIRESCGAGRVSNDKQKGEENSKDKGVISQNELKRI